MSLDASNMSNLFLATSGIQAGAGAVSAYSQSNAIREQGNYQKQVANDNALMLELQAKEVEKQGGRAAALRGKETQALIARQRAAAAGQGVGLESQSVLDMTSDSSMMGALDVESINNDTWRKAWGIRSEASQMRRAGKHANQAAKHESRQTAATGGLQFGRDAIQGAYGAQQLKKAKNKSSEWVD
jgi:hypothetical protein